jgi:hypothetical protein
MITATEGSSRKTQPYFFHKSHNHLYNLDKKDQRRCHPKTTVNRQTWTPKQGVHKQNPTSTDSPSVQNTSGEERGMTYSTMTPNTNTSPPPPETLTLENLRPTLPIGKRMTVSTTSRCPRGVGASELRKTKKKGEDKDGEKKEKSWLVFASC